MRCCIPTKAGKTESVALPAPSRRFSEEPEENGIRGFSSYDILVEAPGYVTVENRNVPVFEDIVSVQPVDMVPESLSQQLDEAGFAKLTEGVVVWHRHSFLYTRIHHRTPGPPRQEAPNVQVSFPDYIKTSPPARFSPPGPKAPYAQTFTRRFPLH